MRLIFESLATNAIGVGDGVGIGFPLSGVGDVLGHLLVNLGIPTGELIALAGGSAHESGSHFIVLGTVLLIFESLAINAIGVGDGIGGGDGFEVREESGFAASLHGHVFGSNSRFGFVLGFIGNLIHRPDVEFETTLRSCGCNFKSFDAAEPDIRDVSRLGFRHRNNLRDLITADFSVGVAGQELNKCLILIRNPIATGFTVVIAIPVINLPSRRVDDHGAAVFGGFNFLGNCGRPAGKHITAAGRGAAKIGSVCVDRQIGESPIIKGLVIC